MTGMARPDPGIDVPGLAARRIAADILEGVLCTERLAQSTQRQRRRQRVDRTRVDDCCDHSDVAGTRSGAVNERCFCDDRISHDSPSSARSPRTVSRHHLLAFVNSSS